MFNFARKKDLKKVIDTLNIQNANLYTALENAQNQQKEAVKALTAKDMELIRASQQVQNLDTVKDNFLTVAAHQLRTPLSSARWNMEAIIAHEYKDDADLAGLASQANECIKQSIDLVNSFLSSNAEQAEKEPYTFASTSLCLLIDLIVNEMKSDIQKKNMHVHLKMDTCPVIVADEKRLLILFKHLISNALRYTLAGGDITLTTQVEGEFLKVSIDDSGVGIPKEQQGQVFEKFFRAENGIRINPNGSGLGLYACKQIVERHEGKIWFISNEKDGTTFYVFLPIAGPKNQ